MKGISVIIWSHLLYAVICEDFCDTFSQSSRVIPFYNISTGEAVLIVGGKYWPMRTNTEQKILSFKTNTSIDLNESLKHFSFPIQWWDQTSNQIENIKYGLFDPKSMTIVEISYSKESFKELSRHTLEDPHNFTAKTTSVLAVQFVNPILVSQHFSPNSQLVSTFVWVSLYTNTNGSLVVELIEDVSSDWNKEFDRYITDGYVFVGEIFFGYYIFKQNGNFSYCHWDDCNNTNPLKPLINCDLYSTTSTTTLSSKSPLGDTSEMTTQKTEEKSNVVYYVIAIIIAIIILSLIVCFFLFFRKDTDPSNPYKIRKKPTKGVKFEKSKQTLSTI